MNDREATGLRGFVHWCETVSSGFITREVFDRNGNRIERSHRGLDGSESHEQWLYDVSGRRQSLEVRGKFIESNNYEYDAHGRLFRITSHSPEAERVAELYTYEDDGSCTLTIFPSPIRRNVEVGIDSQAMLRFSPDAVRVVVQEDRHGKPRSRVLYDIDDRMIRKIAFRYDAEGRLLEEGEVDFGGEICEDFRDEYNYDGKGQCIEKTVYRRGISNRRSILAYNENGDVCEERVNLLPGGIDLSEFIPQGYRPARNWVVVYNYNYDQNLNWTNRVETRSANGNSSSPTLITSRVLQYY